MMQPLPSDDNGDPDPGSVNTNKSHTEAGPPPSDRITQSGKKKEEETEEADFCVQREVMVEPSGEPRDENSSMETEQQDEQKQEENDESSAIGGPIRTEELVVTKKEPEDLVRSSTNPTAPGKLDGYLDENASNAQQATRDSVASQITENRELRGMTKKMDERDRLAKGRAKHGLGSSRHEPVQTSRVSQRNILHSDESPQRHHRMSMSREKRRNTYLQTGLKPGAYPDKSPLESTTESGSDRLLVSRQYSPQASRSEADIAVEPDLEEGRYSSAPYLGMDDQPLVEAFVVADEVPSVSTAPSPKGDMIQPTLVAGDHLEKPKVIADASSLPPQDTTNVKLTDLLLHRQMLLLIGCLICFFSIAIIVVMVLVTTLLGNTTGTQAHLSASGNSPVQANVTALPEVIQDANTEQTAVATTEPTGLFVRLPTPSPIPQTLAPSPPPTEKRPAAKENIPSTTPPPQAPIPPTNSPSATTRSPAMTRSPTPSPSRATVAIDLPTASQTATPTLDPTLNPTAQPTMMPSVAPTFLITPSPTSKAPTAAPTSPSPTLIPTSTPSVATPDGEPTPEPTEELTFSAPSPTIPDVNSVLVDFTVVYTLDSEGFPSVEEQSLLDDELLDFFAAGLRTGLDSDSASRLYAQSIEYSEQRLADLGWWQNLLVEFTFEGGLPPLQVIVDSFNLHLDVDSLLRDTVRPTGAFFSTASALKYEFDIASYGGN